jgi:hypothetical protein
VRDSVDSNAKTEVSGSAIMRALTIAALATAAIGAAGVFRHPLHVDVGYLLDVAQRVLNGERLYVDILEPNPPLVVYLMAVPAGVAGLTGADPVALLRVAALAACVASPVASWWIGRRYLPPTVAAFTVAVATAATLVAEPGEFAQRDGLMIVLLMPYVFAAGARRAARPIPRAVAIGGGVAAGLGIALKPYFLLALVAVELCVAAGAGARSLRRAEAMTAWGILVLYVVFVFAIHREYFAVAALAAEHYRYFAPIARADLAALGIVIALISAWGFVLAWAAQPSRPLAPVLFSVSLALVLSVVLQGKGFPYHWVPTYVATAAMLALAAAATATSGRWPHRVVPAVLLTGALVVFSWRAHATVDAAWQRLEGYPYYLSGFARIVESAAPGEPVFSFWVAPGFPLVTYSSASWGSSFSSHWLLPSMRQRALRGEDVSSVRRFVLDAIAKDLAERDPGLLLVDLRPRYNNLVGFDFLAFMRSDRVVAAHLERYEELTRVGEFLVLRRSDIDVVR